MVDGGINQHGHPIGKIDDICIVGVHYESFSLLKAEWDKRKKRVNFDNLFIVSTDEFINSKEEQ